MKIDAPNLNHLWAQLMIEELIRNGVTHFFVAPGSRSSPLSLAVAGNPRAQMTVHFDERGLAFAALGCARATGFPAAVITTSGTAVANLFPAVIEASMDHVPMILLTGDRPPELRDCGANQAIDQVKIFGDYVRWFFDVPCPDEKISPRFVLTTIDQAVARACAETGPVHLNCQFREPLEPVEQKFNRSSIERELKLWFDTGIQQTRYDESPELPTSHDEVLGLLEYVRYAHGAIIDTGQFDSLGIAKLAEQVGWPLIADIRSILRTEGEAISHADQILLSEKFSRKCRPHVVIQFGARLVSKRIQQWLESVRPEIHLVVAPHLERNDPGSTVTHRWRSDAASACAKLGDTMLEKRAPVWLRLWKRADTVATKALESAIADHPLSEPWLAAAVTRMMPEKYVLTVANSMPIRDAEMYASPRPSASDATANRGASGIDGTIATAVGAAIGNSHCASTVVIGDLALLHDLNSLAMVRDVKKPFVIVAINNDGGGIFSFLPVATFPQHFEKVFGMPHGLGFEGAAKMFGLDYVQPKTAKDFESAYREACASNGATLIEVRTNREENVRIHREIQDAVRKAVDRVVR